MPYLHRKGYAIKFFYDYKDGDSIWRFALVIHYLVWGRFLFDNLIISVLYSGIQTVIVSRTPHQFSHYFLKHRIVKLMTALIKPLIDKEWQGRAI